MGGRETEWEECFPLNQVLVTLRRQVESRREGTLEAGGGGQLKGAVNGLPGDLDLITNWQLVLRGGVPGEKRCRLLL